MLTTQISILTKKAFMSKQIIVVFGATGNQGGSVVDTFLEDPELSKKYQVRAVTRDVSKPDAKALQKRGAEVVQGDVDDAASLPRVLHGAHAVYLATFTIYDEKLKERELRQGKAVADAAVAAHVPQLIFSTLPPASALSHHKFAVVAFDVKHEIEQYIRTLPIPNKTYYVPGFFMQNFHTWFTPHPNGDGTFNLSGTYDLTTELPLIDVAADTGKFVAAAVEHPDQFRDKTLTGSVHIYTVDEIVKIMNKATGKKIKYNKISIETYKGFLPPGAKEPLAAMNEYLAAFPYYGPNTKSLVASSAKQARGHLTTLEQYFAKNPLPL
ncbi:hypothetical protein BGZ83_010577 [Gryganskiella cystojenkinii]|nr:hypothetical protein BGZ83_010577 [Gryganskiella cystojenkinii]